MKFAAIADVHGNIAALEAVLADIAALGIYRGSQPRRPRRRPARAATHRRPADEMRLRLHPGQATIRYVPYDNRGMAELAARNGNSVWASALATGWVR
jgi:hypothetical protein